MVKMQVLLVPITALPQSTAPVMHSMLRRASRVASLYEPVGDFGHPAALFPLHYLYAVAHGIHHLHQIFAELRVIVVDVASMEICDLPCILLPEPRVLLGCTM